MREKIFDFIEFDREKENIDWYDRFMYICILLSIVPLFFKNSTPGLLILEKITVSIFIVDYVMRWFTADIYYKEKGIKPFLKYPFSFFAIVDLLSILPSITLINPSFKLFRLIRLGKTFRVLKILRYSKSFTRIINAVKRERESLIAVCVLAIGYVLISALVIFQAEPDSFNSFFDAVYWSVVTLTTIGYGDISPSTDFGRLISMISAFIGVAIVALPTGIITAAYMTELEKEKEDKFV